MVREVCVNNILKVSPYLTEKLRHPNYNVQSVNGNQANDRSSP